MNGRDATAFFAIPCGEFYSVQSDIVRRVCKAAKVTPIVAEDDPETKDLWGKIEEQIRHCDFFVADISSGSPNVILELGYAIREKSTRNVGIFVSESARVPSDLSGYLRQQYRSFADFQKKLVDWLCDALPGLDRESLRKVEESHASFSDDFMSESSFRERWSVPPGAACHITHEGLSFSNAHFPILTEPLALLQDCEFEFTARIDTQRIGWIVRGTKAPMRPYPSFCIMFNLAPPDAPDPGLKPHIWHFQHPHPTLHYHPFDRVKVDVSFSEEGWFTLATRISGDTVEVVQAGRTLYKEDFSKPPFSELYCAMARKEGQVGFRCHPDEVATVRRMKVVEL